MFWAWLVIPRTERIGVAEVALVARCYHPAIADINRQILRQREAVRLQPPCFLPPAGHADQPGESGLKRAASVRIAGPEAKLPPIEERFETEIERSCSRDGSKL